MISTSLKASKKASTWTSKLSRNCIASCVVASLIVFVAIVYFYQTLFTQSLDGGGNISRVKERGAKAVKAIVNNLDDSPFELSARQILFEIGGGSSLHLKLKKPVLDDVKIYIELDDPTLIDTLASFIILEGSTNEIHIPLHSKDVAGECTLSFKSKQENKILKGLFKIRINIRIVHNIYFGYLSIFTGWSCFVLWSISFYPQVWTNVCRRSVVGLSLDYVVINTVGHYCYLVFNASMYFNTYLQREYTKLHPKGDIPVKLNDVFFSIHAAIIMTLVCLQCILYERGNQRVSVISYGFVAVCVCFICASLFGAVHGRVTWLSFIFYFSYIKVLVTPVKYTPQVYLNWCRKNTEGFNIRGCIMDFGGSFLNTCQMLIDSFNHDNLDETLGNPGKLFLGLIGIMYNLVFMYQRFILYRDKRPSKEVSA